MESGFRETTGPTYFSLTTALSLEKKRMQSGKSNAYFVEEPTFRERAFAVLEKVYSFLKKVYSLLQTVFFSLDSLYWRKTVLFVCFVALAFDPLFLYIPVIDSQRFCFTLDKNLGVVVCGLRTFIDTFYLIHIIFQFITVLILGRSEVYVRGEIVVQSKEAKLKRRILFYFFVDFVSVLPIPQVLVLTLIQKEQSIASLVTKEVLKWVILCQCIPRIIRMYPIFKEVTRDSGSISETKWAAATLNLFFYLLPSHVIGALWYLNAIEKKDTCWREACSTTPGCNLSYLRCSRGGGDNIRFLNTSCPLIDPGEITNSTVFDFGFYIDAFKSGVVESRDFPRKFFYCFWWGLRNLSTLGQSLTSNNIWEILFSILVCIFGLLLFAVLIGNVQKYLQATTVRAEEREERERDTEKWMSYRKVPNDLKERIKRYNNYKWQETRDIEEEALLDSFPKDLRLEAKRHLYLKLLKNVPWLHSMDDGWLLEALCARVKSVFYSANSCIVREGDPVEEMLIITSGELKCSTRGGGNIGSKLKAGDICGELLFWTLDPHHLSRLPKSNRTVKTLTDVEALILLPDDVTFVGSHLKRFRNSKFKYLFRYHSEEWRTWGASYIQRAWSRLKRKRTRQAAQLSLGATINMSRFVSKTLGNTSDVSRFPYMLPHKPTDLEFSE